MAEYSVIEIMNEGTLAAASTVPTAISGAECEVFNTGEIDDLSITAECTFGESGTADVVVYVYTSPSGDVADATAWDTEEYASMTLTRVAGERVQKTIVLEADPHFMTCVAVNEDATEAITDLIINKVTTGK